jgi:hypothetical protein
MNFASLHKPRCKLSYKEKINIAFVKKETAQRSPGTYLYMSGVCGEPPVELQ